jgi:hypothetical protein
MLAPAFMQWHIGSSDGFTRSALTEGLRLPPIMAVVQGVPSGHRAKALLEETSACPDPFVLTGMEPAVDLIHQAVIQGERVLAGRLEINTWHGTEGTQLRIRDERPSRCEDVGSC